MSDQIHTIAVLTSGGDAPGMNAAIYGIYKAAAARGIRVLGIRHGYAGLLKEDMISLTESDVKDISKTGGTILKTSRCDEFKTAAAQNRAAAICRNYNIQALIVIGGDGSFQGAYQLSQLGTNIIGIPATIDLDVGCSEYTLGFDTAVNSAMESIDKIKASSDAHSCCSVIEVMGRQSGSIALWCSIANLADCVFIPEKTNMQKIISYLSCTGFFGGTIILAEGAGKADQLASFIETHLHLHARPDVLGFLQRGGSPTCTDRVCGSMMGARAVDLIAEGITNQIIVIKDGRMNTLDISAALSCQKAFPKDLYCLSKILGRHF